MQRKNIDNQAITDILPAEVILNCLDQLDAIDSLVVCLSVCQQLNGQAREATIWKNAENKYKEILNHLITLDSELNQTQLLHYLESKKVEELKSLISKNNPKLTLYYPSYEQNNSSLFARRSVANLYLSQAALNEAIFNKNVLKRRIEMSLPIAALEIQIIDQKDKSSTLKFKYNASIQQENIKTTTSLRRG